MFWSPWLSCANLVIYFMSSGERDYSSLQILLPNAKMGCPILQFSNYDWSLWILFLVSRFSKGDDDVAKLFDSDLKKGWRRSNHMWAFRWDIWLRSSSGHHHPHELFVVDVSVSINVCLSNHLVYFLVSQFLTQVGHHVSQLSSWDESVSITIEHLKGLD